MAEFEKALKPDFRPISVSIIDIVGVFLPGLVWAILLITVGQLVLNPRIPSYRRLESRSRSVRIRPWPITSCLLWVPY
jgi:hypothetical protein